MIKLMLLLAMQSPEPEIRTESFTYEMPPMELTPEIAPMVKTYYECAFPVAFGTHRIVVGKEETNARTRMAACAETRAWAISAAVSAYKPRPGGERDAKLFVNRAFDAVDAGGLGLAKVLDSPHGTAQEIDVPSQPDPSPAN